MCHPQTEDSSVHQLEGEYQSVISALRSKLDSRAAPPILHLDTSYLQRESSNTVPSPTSSTGKPFHTGPSTSSISSSSEESQKPWSFLTALMNEIQKLRTEDGIMIKDESQSETSSNRDAPTDVTWSTTSEDFTFAETEDRTDLKSLALLLPVQSTAIVQTVTEADHAEMTAEPRQTSHSVKSLTLQRKYRSLLRKRQTPGANGKSMSLTQLWQNLH